MDVSEDPRLGPDEKQLSITTTKSRDAVLIHSEIGSVTKRLLAHPEFEERSRRTDDDSVVAVTGTLPISYLSIGSSGRQDDHFVNIVSGGVLNGS